MKKILILTVLMNIFSISTFARNNTSQNIEALENINTSLERIENAITTLTSQNEENTYQQKQTKAESIVLFKDIKLQIQEIKDEQNKLSKELNIQKIEIENLKNIISMLKDKKFSTATEDPKTIVENSELLVQKNETPKEEAKNNEDEKFKKSIEQYNKKNFTDSAIGFAANLKEFPNGKKFHENLLYLGLSMKELGNKNNACTAFAKIINSTEIINTETKKEAQKNFDELQCNPSKETNTEVKKENNDNKK